VCEREREREREREITSQNISYGVHLTEESTGESLGQLSLSTAPDVRQLWL
jgi:hypothetical protein